MEQGKATVMKLNTMKSKTWLLLFAHVTAGRANWNTDIVPAICRWRENERNPETAVRTHWYSKIAPSSRHVESINMMHRDTQLHANVKSAHTHIFILNAWERLTGQDSIDSTVSMHSTLSHSPLLVSDHADRFDYMCPKSETSDCLLLHAEQVVLEIQLPTTVKKEDMRAASENQTKTMSWTSPVIILCGIVIWGNTSHVIHCISWL